MARLEDLTRGVQAKGVRTDGPVEVVDVECFGTAALELTYKDAQGRPGNERLYRADEPRPESSRQRPRLELRCRRPSFPPRSKAYRTRLAHLFDPLLAVHTSLVEQLPHQIKAVYGEMLTRQPLRFVLADDPGAGKTIMAGLFIKELVTRGDLKSASSTAPAASPSSGRTSCNGIPAPLRDPHQPQARVGPRRTGSTRTTWSSRGSKAQAQRDVQAKLESARFSTATDSRADSATTSTSPHTRHTGGPGKEPPSIRTRCREGSGDAVGPVTSAFG